MCMKSVAPARFCGNCGEEMQKKGEDAAAASGFCTGCGSPLSPDAQFCGQCGNKRAG